MFTSIDKALVAAIMGILYIVQTYTGIATDWVSAETVATLVGIATPLLVWAVPNKAV